MIEDAQTRYQKLSPAKRITRARARLIVEPAYAFWGQLALKLEVVRNDRMHMPTMATDGDYLYYDSKYVQSVSEVELYGLVAHEILHCVLGHVWRGGTRIPLIWNFAIDMVVNQMLTEYGFQLPEGVLMPPPELRTASAERIYAWLLKQPEVQKLCAQLGRNDSSRSGSINPQTSWGQSHDDHSLWERKAQSSEDQKTEEEGAWRASAAAAATAARQQQGSLPAGLERLVTGLLTPKVDWRSVLAQFMTSLRQDDFNWRVTRKVPMAGGKKYYAPKLRSEGVELAVAIDTSGSISGSMLERFLSETTAILWSMGGVELVLYACDAQVHAVWHIGPDDPIPTKLPGGGGTSFVPVFKRVEKDFPGQPDALIYFTDSYGTFPSWEPDYPVLWVVDAPPKTYKIPFGQVVEYTEES